MKLLKYILGSGFIFLSLLACQDFLDADPKGTLSDDLLNTPENVEKMAIAAYSLLENDNRNQSSVWYNGMRGGDAYKGGGGTSDMAFAYDLEVSSTIQVNRDDYENKWNRTYVAISRANNALARIQNLEAADFPLKEQRAAEMLFLRAHHHFQIKELFKHIVWMDETIPQDEIITQSNRKYTDQELWDKIADDFRVAANVLPDPDKTDIGRANKYSAKAYLAKTLLFAAYVQDEKHNVTSIDRARLEEVVKLTDEIIGSGFYRLNEDFAYNFLWEYENGPESILAIQSTHDDGTTYGRLNQYGMLSYPHSAEYGCCGMHLPSQSLVNAFKTSSAGLPLFDTYQDSKILTGEDLDKSGMTVDPRLMHTVGILGRPYKYMPEYLVNSTFIRDSLQYGAFLSMKETEKYTCPCVLTARWFPGSSLNRDILRYDEVLLWKAEALIELDREREALPIINMIRTRAQNSTNMLVMVDPADSRTKPSANFNIGLYTDGASWTKEYARKVLRWERRLEFAMESRRGEDIVRWGIAAEEQNEYYAIERIHRTTSFYNTAEFTKNKHEYLPIPSKQISFSRGLYVQNYGYETL
ncbi:MAG: RagB/SusD family nutrient uptake outer membrane protein [Tannerellaceae bacterium]|nr:RagB/SusD family nutrient uptake outer membrane protein [Tannerellaceae bacterium]